MSSLAWRRLVVGLLVVAQLLVLGWMAGKRELIRAYGQEVYLRTAPIDPRDPFRGDFVRLDYPFSSVPLSQTRGTLSEQHDKKGLPVYALLKPMAGGLHQLDYLTDQQPTDGLYMRGRISAPWRGWGPDLISVRYGIEQYFVEQGQGRAIEQRRGQRNELQVPMEVRVALGSDGTAVLKDFRWSRLGIQLELLRFNRRGSDGQPQDPEVPLSPRVLLTLKNVSDQPLRLADPAAPCALQIEPVAWARDRYQAVNAGCADTPAAWLTLAPEASHLLELELSESQWWVMEEGEAREIGALEQPAMFRLRYHSGQEGRLPNRVSAADAVWIGELPSRAFNALGQID